MRTGNSEGTYGPTGCQYHVVRDRFWKVEDAYASALRGRKGMLEFIASIGIDPIQLLLILAGASLAFTLLYRKYVFNLFDPLIVFIISMVANTALMCALPWEVRFKWEFVFFAIFLWIGFVAAARKPKSQIRLTFPKEQLFDLEVVLVLLCGIIIVANLYLGASTGFPIFSDNPSVTKVTSYSGGLGIVRRINMGPYVFCCCGCVYLAMIRHQSRLAIALLTCSSVFIMMSGSKGALLSLVFAQATALGHPGLTRNHLFVAKVKRYALYTLILGTVVALTVLIRDQGSFSLGVLALFKRILLTGDVILLYFADRARVVATTQQSLLGYLQYLMGETLSMLRLKEYAEPLGSVILGIGNTGFGPNAQYFVVADLFFGPILGCLYSFVVGYAIGYLRTIFIKDSRSSPILFVLKLTLAVLSFSLVTEAADFVNEIVTTVLILSPLWLLARLTRLAMHRGPLLNTEDSLKMSQI